MIPQWQTGVVKRISQLTENTRHYWIEVPDVAAFQYLPGQFVTLDLPIHAQRNKRWRSYSIAAMCSEKNVIELTIGYVPDGLASAYIFNTVKEGTLFTLRGPQGNFLLPQTIDKDIFMICTGTGIAPYRSMLQHIAAHNIPHRNIYLVFGTKMKKDLLFFDEMQALTTTIPNFVYLPTLSREQWEGRTGYVHPIYVALCKELQPAIFMLCGQRLMIDDAKERIMAMGYSNKDIHIEIYG